MRRISILVILLIGLLPLSTVGADNSAIAQYDLTLLGYRAGMTYDQAAAVRPIQRVATVRHSPENQPLLEAYIDNFQVEDFNLKIKLEFSEERLTKVIARFSPVQFENLYRVCVLAYGNPEDHSKTIDAADGSTLIHTTYIWDFPGAKIVLLRSSINTDFATFSLLAHHSHPAHPKPKGHTEEPAT